MYNIITVCTLECLTSKVMTVMIILSLDRCVAICMCM